MKHILEYSLFESKKKTTEEFIKDAKSVHGDKYDYSKSVYVDAITPITIICPRHGEFEQLPSEHTSSKKGCKKCGEETKKLKQTKTTQKFIEEAKKLFGDRFDYSLVDYTGNKENVNIICKKHDITFPQSPVSHLRGSEGCPKCKFEQQSKLMTKPTQQFIEEAKSKFGDRYDYSLVDYKHSKSPITVICNKPNHGEFYPTPNDHLSGKGCPKCSESKGERFINLYLKNKNISFIPQYKFNDLKLKAKLPFDFYLLDLNTCIEYDGLQHYIPYGKFGGEEALIKQQQKDKLKTDYCKNNNIRLIRIPYWDIKNIPDILDKELDL